MGLSGLSGISALALYQGDAADPLAGLNLLTTDSLAYITTEDGAYIVV